VTEPRDDWPRNYYNYFTEAEEHFQRARGTALFRFSPLDWALLEAWKNGGIPLEAVLRGIDAAFEKWRAKKSRTQAVNSLAFCAQAVMREAEILAGAAPPKPAQEVEAPFSLSELEAFLERTAAQLRDCGREPYAAIADSLDGLRKDAALHYQDLEQLEQRLAALEDKMLGAARSEQTDDDLFHARRELDAQLRPYRSKMTADQLSMLEKQYLDRRLLERLSLPRLSLFYLR